MFFLWEAGCYLFITKSFRGDVIVFLLLYPKYLGIIRYVFVTLEPNENKKTNFLRKSGSIFSKIKIPLIIIHIVATLTIILLMLGLALLFSQHQLFLLLVFVLIVSALISFVFLICYKWLGMQNILSLQVILYSLTILVLYAYSSEIFKIVPK